MTSREPNPSNPAFQTPQPAELQSEETRKVVLDRLSAQQQQESDAIDPDSTSADSDRDSDRKDVAFLDNMDELKDRHITRLDSPPG